LACAALAGCASSGSKYSQRVVRDGDPIPKGGGSYKVGQPYRLNGKTYYPADNPNYRGEGIASWYGPDFHGRLTANGEIYDMNAISAAHPTMPLPSYARVTNLDNGHSIVVRVNDRGPYARNRVIDMSIGAAKALDFYKRGLAHVRVEYVGRAPIEGSDDRQLMATLRHGHPAPAPSETQVAALTPLSPLLGPWRGGARVEEETEAPSATPTPAERPYKLGAAATANAAARADAGPRVRMVTPRAAAPEPAPAPPVAAAYAPIRNDVGLGLMSGRGLY
jgi:rare lipoprotein A